MATLKGSRNNTLAGTLVISAVVGTVVIVILLAGGLEVLGTRTYTVSFDFQTGVEGIEPGADVALGGKRIGSVSKVMFHPRDVDTIEAIHVRIAVDKSLQFKEGAVALLEKPLLGATSTINFVNMGDGDPLDENYPITGRLAPPAFLAQAGYGEAEQTKVRSIIDRADEITENFRQTSKRINETFLPRAETIADDMGAITSDAREKWPEWSQRVDEVFDNVGAVREDVQQFIANLNERTDQIREVLVSAQRYLSENEEDVRETIRNARSVSEEGEAFVERLNTELFDQAKSLLASGEESLRKAGETVDEARAVIAEQRPNINATLANFRLSSDQLKDTLVEIRASPWRLLYRPNMRELEYELLYNSARSYARAVGELRILADRMDALLSKPQSELTEDDREAIRRFADELETTRRSYKRVEDAFLDQLLESRPSGE